MNTENRHYRDRQVRVTAQGGMTRTHTGWITLDRHHNRLEVYADHITPTSIIVWEIVPLEGSHNLNDGSALPQRQATIGADPLKLSVGIKAVQVHVFFADPVSDVGVNLIIRTWTEGLEA